MGQASSKTRNPHLDQVLVWTIFVKKQKWSIATLPIPLRKGIKVSQGDEETSNINIGTLAKSATQKSTTFVINVQHNVVFDQWQDIHFGTYKIEASQLIKAVPRWYPRLLSQSHMSHEEIFPLPSPRVSTINIKDSTVTSYTALDLAESKNNRRSRNLRTILNVELDNRKHDHKTSVTSAHVDSLHHQKKLKAVKEFFGNDRKLFYISVKELEQVCDDAGIGHLEFTQTMGVEGIPMNKKQRKNHSTLSSEKQLNEIKTLLAETFKVMSLHVHVLAVREGLETVENPPPKKLSIFQRFYRWITRKKKVKLRRSEVDYMISTRSGPPALRLEKQQRLLVKVGQTAKQSKGKKITRKDGNDSSSSDSSSDDSDSDGDSGSDSSSDSDDSSSDDDSDDEDAMMKKKKEEEANQQHVAVQYTDQGVFANILVDPLGDLVGLLDQDIEHPALIVAHEPIRELIIPIAGFATRKSALLDFFGSYLTKKKHIEKEERRVVRKSTMGMKMGRPSPKKRSRKRNKKKGTKYAVVTDTTTEKKLDFDEFDEDDRIEADD